MYKLFYTVLKKYYEYNIENLVNLNAVIIILQLYKTLLIFD